MREVRLTYRLTEADLLEGQKHAKHPGAKSGMGDFLLLLTLITVLYTTPAIWDHLTANPNRQPLARQIVVGGMPWVYVGLWAWLNHKFIQRRSIRDYFQRNSIYQLEFTTIIHDDGLIFETPCSSDHIAWGLVIGFSESHNLFVVYTAGNYHLLPKRALASDADLQGLRKEMGERINSLGAPPLEFSRRQAQSDEPAVMPRLHFTLSAGDFAHARQLVAQSRMLNLAKDMAILLPLYMVFYWITRTVGPWVHFSFFWVLIGNLVLMLAVQIFVNRWRWRQVKHLHGPQAVDVLDSGLRFQAPEGPKWIGWGAIQRWRRDNRLFAIRLRDGTLRCIPEKAFLTKESGDELSDLLYERVVPVAGFSVVLDKPSTP